MAFWEFMKSPLSVSFSEISTRYPYIVAKLLLHIVLLLQHYSQDGHMHVKVIGVPILSHNRLEGRSEGGWLDPVEE